MIAKKRAKKTASSLTRRTKSSSKKSNRDSSHYKPPTVAIVLLFLVSILVVFMLAPYLLAVLSSVVLTIVFHPLFQILREKLGRKASAVICAIIALLLVVGPMLFLLQVLAVEVNTLSNELPISDLIGQIEPFIVEYGLPINLYQMSENVLDYVSEQIRITVQSLPGLALSLFVTFFLFYYLLLEGTPILSRAFELLPLSQENRDLLSDRFHQVTYGVVYGQVITAVVQGLVGMLGYFMLGLDAPVFLGLLTMLFAFIPLVGTGVVWVPTSILLIAEGDVTRAVMLLFYGAFIIGLIDNFLRPFLIGKHAKLHPAFVLLGVVGGIQAFGIVGLFVGPLILVFARQLIYMLVLGRAYESK